MPSRSRMLALCVLGGLSWMVALAGVYKMLGIGSHSWHIIVLVVVLVVFTIVFWALGIPVGSGRVNVGAIVSYLSIALLGTWVAVGVKFPGIVYAVLSERGLSSKRKATLLMVNVGVMSVTVLAAGLAYTTTGGPVGAGIPASSAFVAPYLVMSMTYTLTNWLLLACVSALLNRQVVWGSLVDRARQFWVNGLLFALVGLLTQVLYSELGLPGLLLVFGALLAVRFTFQQYAANQTTRSEMAGLLSKALGFKDAYTGEHSQRVAGYSVAIGRQLGLTDAQSDRLRDAALLHDIGKVAVPDAVLIKPGPLDVAEKISMERHVGAGGDLLEQSPHLRELAGYVRAHHAQLGEETVPPLLARIIAVADAFDAMTSDRPYRRALPLQEAVQRLLDGKGTQFDVSVVDALLVSLEAQGHHFVRPATAQTLPPTADTPAKSRSPQV